MSRGKPEDYKKKPMRVAGAPAEPGLARSLGENTGRVLRPFAPLALMLALFATGSVLLWRSIVSASPSAEGAGTGELRSADRLTAQAIRAAVLGKPRPAWIVPQDFEQAASMGLYAQGRSIFEPGLSRALMQQYKKNSWVEEVREIRLRYPARMEVEIDWRCPAARLERGNLVVDRNGVVLNLNADLHHLRDLPVISGFAVQTVEAGTPVREKEVLEALQLLGSVRGALESSPGKLKVTLLKREPSGTWRVATDRGPLIFWGSYTDDPEPNEPRTKEKADLLRRRLCEIKDPAVLEYIRVDSMQAPFKPRAQGNR